MTELDAAIFREVVLRLEARGIAVHCIPESDMLSTATDGYDAVITMARNVDNLRRFNTQLPCFNSTEGILACSRKGMVADILAREGLPQPLYNKGIARARRTVPFPLWVKNGESCSQTEDDTMFVTDERELSLATDSLTIRGVGEWLLQQHVEGDLVKFYGVEGTDFFHWLYPHTSHSKHGQERRNGQARGYAFSPDELKRIADKAAKAMDVPVYGGDCIVDAQGRLFLIDFNDWPSFYCCRQRAADAIAERVTRITIQTICQI